MNWWTEAIAPPDGKSEELARERQAMLTKPPGSLGVLEDIATRFAGFQGDVNPALNHVEVVVFAGDHGVVEAGVSAFPQAVTVEMIRNFSRGGAAISVLARNAGAQFSVLNLGTVAEVEELPAVHNLALAPGTANFTEEPAMSETTVLAALSAGADAVPAQAQLFIGGEMGIGNTTAAAAISSSLLELPAEVTVGRGTGIDDQALGVKRDCVARAIVLHGLAADDPLQVLRCVGGLEIAGLAGACLGAAQKGVPVLVDGYICSAAALVACRLNPGVRDWLLFAHRSAEPGHRHILDALEAEPLLDFGMRLGEGSGAAVALPLLRSALDLHNEMATFAEAAVSEKVGG